VTPLPERAFSKAFNGLLEKLGAEAVCKEREKGVRLKKKREKKKKLSLCRSAVLC